MATKQKNIPALAELKSLFIYIDASTAEGKLSQFAGRLMPADLFHGKSIGAVCAILTEYEELFSLVQDASRYIKIKGHRMPEAKLVWYYHKGKYPMTAMEHDNGNLMDSRVENLSISNSVKRNAESVRKNKLALVGRLDTAQLQSTPASGVVGIYYITSGYNAHMWKVEYITNKVKEVPCDADGKVIDWRTRGWHIRQTKLVHTRSKTFLGFYVTLDEAKRALKLHTNEVQYGVCRWYTDNKIKTLCSMINSQKDGLYTYLNMLSYRELLPLGEVSEIADKLGYGNRPLQVRS